MLLRHALQRYITVCTFIAATLFLGVVHVHAYYTNMPASVVVGQPDFVTNSAGVSSAKLGNDGDGELRGVFVDPQGRLIVSDGLNNRVLIWNRLPTQNGQPADLVLGQSGFDTNLCNNGGLSATSMCRPAGIWSDGNKLIIADSDNWRILIWNTFPTHNGQVADVVAGQKTFTSTATGCDQSHFKPFTGGMVWVYNNKLIVTTANAQRRVLIWNSLPATNGVPADLVLGQANFSTCTAQPVSASSLGSPRGVTTESSGRLFIADSDAQRVLIWNRFPTSNNQPADVVIGHRDFTSNTTALAADGFNFPQGVSVNGNRLFVGDNNNKRVLIFNSIPMTNGASADIVLGEPDFVTNTSNDSRVSAQSMSFAHAVFAFDNKLVAADSGNNRILIFDNQLPDVSLSRTIAGQPDGKLRFSGTASTNVTNEVIKQIEYSSNDSTWTGAFPTDGKFDSASEGYYFDFDPTVNTMADNQGYTVKIRSTHDNDKDVGTSTFYFQPFLANGPLNNSFTVNRLPSFTFTIQKVRFPDLRENLDHFRVMVKQEGGEWQSYIDFIPVDYYAVRKHPDNLRPNPVDTMNGTYEDKFKTVTYDQDNSVITVSPKAVDSQGNASDKYWENGGKLLSNATYLWKIQAEDHAGQLQETDPHILRIGTRQVVTSRPFFPLSIYEISGIPGYLDISTLHPDDNPKTLTISAPSPKFAPTFAGIATAGSTVCFTITDTALSTSSACFAVSSLPCSTSYQTTVKPDSTFRITVPKAFKPGNSYDVTASVKDTQDNYNELPTFTVQVGVI